MKKKILIATIVLVGLLTSQAFGIAQFYIQPRTTTAAVGTRFSILINLRNNVDSVYVWQYSLNWVSGILRCDSILEGPYLSRNGRYPTIFVFDNRTPGRAVVGASLIGKVPCATGDGNLARMVFYVLSVGSCSLRFAPPEDNILLDNNLREIPLTVENGYFQTPVGVEEKSEVRSQKSEVRITATPNPFSSFATIPGHEKRQFSVYDISGKLVGIYKGDRIGEDLNAGVYFIGMQVQSSNVKVQRIVKVR